jgi:hypothetical protein
LRKTLGRAESDCSKPRAASGLAAGIGLALAMRMMTRRKIFIVTKTQDGRPADHREPIAPGGPGVLLLIDTPDALSGDFPFSIERLGIGVLSVQAPESDPVADEPPVDVALIRLGHPELDALAEAGRLLRRDPAIEIVFFSDGEGIDSTIAEALGLNRIVPADKLVDWLRLAGPHLVCQTQARRLLLAAARNIPPIPPFAARLPDRIEPLPAAEQRFREAYLRSLLGRGRDRETVARMAGVPYRTLCQMIRKLDIDVPAQRPGRRPSRRPEAEGETRSEREGGTGSPAAQFARVFASSSRNG